MVWNPERKEVNVKRMMIYSVIPFLNVYSSWRIQKFWVIQLLLFPFGIMNQLALTYTDNLLVGDLYNIIPLIITIVTLIVSVMLTKTFAQRYNLSVLDSPVED
jgi:hypothetical protein